MTEYVVLKKVVDADESTREGWAVVKANVEARSSDVAIRETVGADGEDGTYVAVPRRNFEPVTVKVEREPRVVVSRS